MRAVEAVSSLPDGLARFLAERGIRGTREDGHECPIAVYLTQRLASYLDYGHAVSVDAAVTDVWDKEGNPVAGANWQSQMPRDFIKQFDDTDAWPELVR